MQEVLAAPGLGGVELLAGQPTRCRVDHVLVDQRADPPPAASGALLVLTDAATREARYYKLDILLRRAGTAGVGAVVLTGPDRPRQVSESAVRIAERGAVTVLASDGCFTDLVLDASAAVAGDAVLALRALRHAVAELSAQSEGTPIAEEVVVMCGRILDQPVDVSSTPPEPGSATAAAPSPTEPGRSLRSRAGVGHRGTVVEIVLHLGASALLRADAARDAGEGTALRSTAALLAELVLGSDLSPSLVGRARSVGFPVDAWHVVARLEPRGVGADTDVVHRWEALELGVRVALTTAKRQGQTWHAGQLEGAVLLVRSRLSDPGREGAREFQAAVRAVAAQLQRAWHAGGVAAGVGTAKEGVAGLRASAAEARAVLAGLTADAAGTRVAVFDGAGLGRLLRDWYASDSAQAAVADLFAPLERLRADRADEAVRTLTAWLEEGGSAVAAGQRLYLHRNTVRYRITRLERLLDLDLTDADTRLSLLLACRARRLGVAAT